MPDARCVPAQSPRNPSERARARALVTLAARRSAARGWVRLARWLVPAIGVGFASLMLVVRFGTGAANVDLLLERAIGVICWVGGGLTMLGLARPDDETDERDGIGALVHLRGHGNGALAGARWVAATWVVAGTLGPTVLGLATLEVILARSVSDLRVALALGVGAVAFVAIASVTLALVARAASALDPRRPRLMLAALLLIPELLQAAGLAVPSVPGALAAVLAQTFTLGTGIA